MTKRAAKRLSDQYNLRSLFPEIAKEWDYGQNDGAPEQYYPHSNKVVSWKCSLEESHTWQASINQRTSGRGLCPFCTPEHGTSFPEQTLFFYLNGLFGDCENRSKLNGYEIDVLLPNPGLTPGLVPGLAIEYDGCYYHSESTRRREERKRAAILEEQLNFLAVKEYRFAVPQEQDGGDIIWVKAGPDYQELDRMVVEVVSYINRLYTCHYQVSPDSRRDSANILKQYLSRIKERSLEATHPHLLDEWHTLRNGFPPSMVTAGSEKVVWWKCPQGHEYESGVYNRCKSKTGCPYCSNRRVSKTNSLGSHNKKLAREYHPHLNQLSVWEIAPMSGRKVWWRCSQGHEWEAAVCDRAAGNGCPYCSGKRATPATCLSATHPHLAREWVAEESGLTPLDVTAGSGKTVLWRCAKGHEWTAKIQARTNKKHVGCPYCAGIRCTPEKSLAALRPDLAAQFHPTKNGGLSPEGLHLNSNKPVWWRCGNGHEW